MASAAAEERRVDVAPSGVHHVHTLSPDGQTRFILALGTCFSSNNLHNMNLFTCLRIDYGDDSVVS